MNLIYSRLVLNIKDLRTFVCSVFIFILFVFPAFKIFPQSINDKESSDDSLRIKQVTFIDSSKIMRVGNIFLQGPKSFPNDKEKVLIKRDEIENVDYRTITDVLAAHPFSFLKNLGSLGTPNQLLIYGQPIYKTSIFLDGIEINNRMISSYQFENFVNENANDIEIIPLSASFLFGNTNIATINFVKYQPDVVKPFSRIKFYQGADDEGFIDGIINLSPIKKLITYLEISNQTYGGRFTNSEFSSWKGIVRGTYLFSDKINFMFGYSHSSSSSQLYGGVDIDSISKSYGTANIESIAFDNILAPVRFSNRYMNSISDRIDFTFLTMLSQNNYTEISVFYQNNEIDFRQNISGTLQNNVFPIKREEFNLTKGIKFRSDFKNDQFDFFVQSNFERNQFNSQFLTKQNLLSFFNVSVGSKIELLKNLTTSFYGKFLTQAQETYLGFGSDLCYQVNDELNLFVGLSSYKNPFTFYERRFVLNKDWKDYSQIKNIETRISFNSQPFYVALGYFKTSNNNYLIPAFLESQYKNDEAYFAKSVNSNFGGMNLKININYWKIYLENNLNYFLDGNERNYRGLPEFNFSSSLFYKDILFKKNLDLKIGLKFNSIGNRIEQRFDFEKGISSPFIYNQNTGQLNKISNEIFAPSYQFDFFLIGKIQESATVYLTWENILDNKYYIIPYYPTYPRNLRFGVAWNFLD